MIKNYDDIKNEYGYIRHKNLSEYEENKAKLYANHKKLKELDYDIVSTYIESAKSAYTGANNDEFEDKLKSLKSEREKYIKENGIPDDYLEVKYTCPKCKDTGFIDGKKCSCFIEKEIELFDKISHFKDYIKNDNFENLNENYYNQDIMTSGGKSTYKDYMRRVILHMKDAINNASEKPYNAILIGTVGTGKTFLARCIGSEFLKNNHSVLYANVNEYLNSLKPDYEDEPLEKYAIAVDLFIIDDLGTENSTEFTNSKLNYIIDKRLADNKSTIITTNLTPEEIERRYLNSMVSRVMCIYQKYFLQGDDLRRVKYANIK